MLLRVKGVEFETVGYEYGGQPVTKCNGPKFGFGGTGLGGDLNLCRRLLHKFGEDGWTERCKEKNGDRIFDIEIGRMSKSNIIKYCRDEWIVIPADVMSRLRGKEKKE